MKNHEQLAEEYAFNIFQERYESLIGEEQEVYSHAKDAFLAGYKAAQPQWISVKERLPEFGDWVLLYDIDSNIYRGRLIEDDFAFFATFDGIVFLLEKPGITHWMPVPPEPKEEK
jgi:hypothetical protein